MIRILFGLFLVLHGLVHLLYVGQSARYFALQPGMTWPDGSWILSKVFGGAATRGTASALLVLATVGFVAGGAALLLSQLWWRPFVVGAAVLSALIYLLFWDGGLQKLDNQGGIAILINLAILTALLLFRWPILAF